MITNKIQFLNTQYKLSGQQEAIMQLQNGNIRLQKYEFNPKDLLGKGTTGNVYKGYRLRDGGRVAVKAIDMAKVNNEVTRYLLEGEKTALSSIKNPNVLKTEDIIQDKDFCYIVTQICTGGTLKEYIEKRGKLGQREALEIFKKIVQGYISVVEAKIIHRDLKTANVMMRFYNEPVIIDFGYCEMIFGKRPMVKYNVGSPTYMAPQSKLKCSFSERSDVWALAIILHEMLTGKALDEGKDQAVYFNQLRNAELAPYDSKKFSPLINCIFQEALKTRPQDRCSATKLKYLIDKGMMAKTGAFKSVLRDVGSINPQLRKIRSETDFVAKSHLQMLLTKKQPSQKSFQQPRHRAFSPQVPSANHSTISSVNNQNAKMAPITFGNKFRQTVLHTQAERLAEILGKKTSPMAQQTSKLYRKSMSGQISARVNHTCDIRVGKSEQIVSQTLTPLRMPKNKQNILFTIGVPFKRLSNQRFNEQDSPVKALQKAARESVTKPSMVMRVKSEETLHLRTGF